MNDIESNPKLKTALMALVLLVAAFLRFAHLDGTPLGDAEAQLALAARDVSVGVSPTIGVSSIYIPLTGALFWLFSASEFVARLLPAMAGLLLVALPWLFRNKIGTLQALALSLFFALDPGLVNISRTVNPVILPMAGFGLLMYAISEEKPSLAGFSFAFFALAGPQTWLLALGVVIVLLLEKIAFRQDHFWLAQNLIIENWRSFLVGLFLPFAALALATFVNPLSAGVSIPFASLKQFVMGLTQSSAVPPQLPWITLVMYEGFAVLVFFFGLGWVIRSSGQYRWLLVLSALMMAISVALPNRTTEGIVWLTPALLLAGAFFVVDFYSKPSEHVREILGMFAFSFVLLVFITLNYLSLSMAVLDPATIQLRWTVLIGSFTMMAASLVLVTYGWNFEIAWKGIVSGLLLFTFLLNLSSVWTTAHLRPMVTQELWNGPELVYPEQTLQKQLADLSMWNGMELALDRITLVGIDSPSVVWGLRNKAVTQVPSLTTPDELGPVVLTQTGITSGVLNENYRGQDIVWSAQTLYDSLTVSDWMRWSVLHGFPGLETKYTLWIRADKFIDRQNIQ